MNPFRRIAPALAALAMASAFGAGCGAKLAATGPALPEGVAFAVTPSDAEVAIDNVVRGKASDFPDERPLRLQPGSYRLELRAKDYVTYSRALVVTPLPKRIDATLLRREEPAPPPK